VAGDIDPFETSADQPKIVAVSLQHAGHLYNYLAGALPLKRGDRVLVEGEAGTRLGTIEIEPHEPAQTLDLAAMRPVVRLAQDSDLRVEEDTLTREQNAQRMCVTRIRERDLPMKLVTVDYTYDGRKAIFYFTAENRVDFRDLVRDLANTLRVRVEMKQIGARDESKVTGGIGPCGRELCCSSWLRDFEAVTVKMAREQGLALNPSRLAGMCGRLKCCLRYEYDTYRALEKELPPVHSTVVTPKGRGRVVAHEVLAQKLVVEFEDHRRIIVGTDDILSATPPPGKGARLADHDDDDEPAPGAESRISDRGLHDNDDAGGGGFLP
jgi:cell fate regulator YaaT (PSP1 superfamily)